MRLQGARRWGRGSFALGAAVCLIAGIAAACSSSSSGGGGGTGAGDAGGDAAFGDASTSQTDGATGSDGATTDAGTDAALVYNPAHIGLVQIAQYTSPLQWSAAATFVSNAADAGPDPNTSCTRATAGACSLSICSPVDSGLPTPTPPVPVYTSAGVLEVSGGGIPAGFVLLPTDAGASYQGNGIPEAGTALHNGDVVLVKAAGGEVPAFSTSVVAVPTFALTSPACGGGGCGSLDRTQDLTFTWTGISDGTLVVGYYYPSGGTTQTTIACEFQASKGSGTIPSALLLQFPGPDGGPHQFDVTSYDTTKLVAGDYLVTLQFMGSFAQGALTVSK